MVTAFDIIQYFSVAALFGWLTFSYMTETNLRDIPKRKRKIAKENLIIINQLFILSFLFFALAAISDYLLHHLTISGGVELLVHYNEAIVWLAVSFLTGLGLLIAPIAYILAVGKSGKHLGSFELPRLVFIFGFLLMATASTGLMWTTVTFSTNLFLLFFASGFVPYCGLGLALRFWKQSHKLMAMGIVLILWPVILIFGLALLGVTRFAFYS